MKKKLMITALLLVAALVLVGCTQKAPEPTATPAPVVTEAPTATEAPAATDAPAAEATDAAPAEEEAVELTLEELAEFNGKDGARAYVAVDGIIYDVTDSAFWKDGAHNGFEAGKDLTTEIKEKSPHGVAKLDNVKEIGKLVTE